QKLDGVEHDVRRPITPRLPELQPHLTLVGQVEPNLRHGRTQRIATHALEPIPLPPHRAGKRAAGAPALARAARRGPRADRSRSPARDSHRAWAPRPIQARRPDDERERPDEARAPRSPARTPLPTRPAPVLRPPPRPTRR